MPNRASRIRRIVKIPTEYLEAIEIGNLLFSPLYQFENGLRLLISGYLTTCYGEDWWEISLQSTLPNVYAYAAEVQKRRNAMPWIGSSTRVSILPIHLVTLGHLEEIVKRYHSECIPELFPTMEFFLGHMEVIKRVRNLYTHMFPCTTKADSKVARREISTLAEHINSRL